VTPAEIPPTLWLVWWGLAGLFVGSFLNVCIYRWQRAGMSVTRPVRSVCPSCDRQLTWRENVPVVSWAVQRGRCRGCGWRIPWRYPLVELATLLVWLLAATATPQEQWDLLLVRLLVLSGLIVATAVDFQIFEIPDQVSIGGMVLAPVLALLVPPLHADTWVARQVSEGLPVDRGGALAGCLAGMAVGGGVLLAIGWIGKLVFKRDAMGLGDVKLLSGAGGFIGPGGVVFALVLGSLVASVAGIGNILRFLAVSRARHRARGTGKSLSHSLRSARIAGRYVPFGPYLALGIAVVLLYWKEVVPWFQLAP
jgi:leader peptidase (prepilin peptidase)/N-methyltransferase